jgi:hypothetical protein
VDDKGASNKESGIDSCNIGKDMSLTEKEKFNLTKTDPLSIKNPKKDTLKRLSTKKKKFSCGKDCMFRGKECSFEPGVLSLESGEAAENDLEAERRAEEIIESWNALGRERQAQDETERKTPRLPNPKERLDPNKVCPPILTQGNPDESMSGNQVKVTLTTSRDAEGRITGTSSSRTIFVPAEMSPPDLTPLTNGDEEYILVRVSKEKKKCWVTYLNGQDPDTDREFAINTTVKALLDQEHSDIDLPMPTVPFVKMDRVELKEMIEKRREELIQQRAMSSRDGSHERFRNRLESEPGEKRPPRKLRESCKTQSPSSPERNPSPLEPRTQWMKEDDPRTEEEADAEWRRVTENLFGTNTRTEPKTVDESWGSKEEKTFSPKWGNPPLTQELRDEDKR